MLAVSTSSFLVLGLLFARSYALSPEDIATAYGLTDSKVLPFPSSPVGINDAANLLVSSEGWTLGSKKINNNPQNIQFVTDPFPNASPNTVNIGASPSNSSATVMGVQYPQGSYSHDTGGTQFNQVFDPTGRGGYQSMLLTYEVAFDQNFQFAKGGKLPGLRGGPQMNGCSGGNQPTGEDCFSIRLMWRPLGSGEVYAYIPTPNDICYQNNVRCNSDGFGTSISRATFSFTPGQWTRISMLVRLNDPMYANGELWLYYNDLLAVRMQNIYYRSSDSISSITGMYFSTFFGGNDPSWATPVAQSTYYRNIKLWAGTAPSNSTGQPVKSFSGASTSSSINTLLVMGTLLCTSLFVLPIW